MDILVGYHWSKTLTARTVHQPGVSSRPDQMEAARIEIRRLAGTQFDPAIVKVFLEMKQKVWDELRLEMDAQRKG